jgi:hypothetical protein
MGISLSLHWPAETFLSYHLAELKVGFSCFCSRTVIHDKVFAVGSSASNANNWIVFSFMCVVEHLIIRRQCKSCNFGIQNSRFIDRMLKNARFSSALWEAFKEPDIVIHFALACYVYLIKLLYNIISYSNGKNDWAICTPEASVLLKNWSLWNTVYRHNADIWHSERKCTEVTFIL